MAGPPEQSQYGRRQVEPRRVGLQPSGGPANLADILERVLDKGIVIAGDIQINLLDIELLTIKLRLLVASVERAQEMGINWWESDPALSSHARELEEENEDLRSRLERLEQMAGLPAPQPGEEVVVETRHREVVEERPGRENEEFEEEEFRKDVRERDAEATKDELLERAQKLDVPRRGPAHADRTPEEAELGYYVYGVVFAGQEMLDELPGVDARYPAILVEQQDLAAIASRVPLDEFDEERLRENLNDVQWLED